MAISKQASCLTACILTILNAVLAQQNGVDFSIPSTFTNWDNDNWVLSTDQLIQGQYQSRAPMGNGYVTANRLLTFSPIT